MTIRTTPMRSREETRFLALLGRTQEKTNEIEYFRKKSSSNIYISTAQPQTTDRRRLAGRRARRTRGTMSEERVVSRDSSATSQATTSSNGELSSSDTNSSRENFVGDNHTIYYDWRLAKFVETLETWLSQLEQHPQRPSKEDFLKYKIKVEFLRKVVNSLEEEKLEYEEKQLLSTIAAAASEEELDGRGMSTKPLPHFHRIPSKFPYDRLASETFPTSSVGNLSMDSHSGGCGIVTSLSSLTTTEAREIQQKLQSRRSEKMRSELFGHLDDDRHHLLGGEKRTNSGSRGGLRRRSTRERRGSHVGPSTYSSDGTGLEGNEINDDLDILLRSQHKAQEEMTKEMLSLTQAMKQQSVIAGEIIRKDTVEMGLSSDLVDKNCVKLQHESERLDEHTGSPCRWWIWLLLCTVTFTFVAMVWVMKLFRKRSMEIE